MPPQEENAEFPDFTSEHAHLLLQGVYGDFLHNRDESHLDGGIADDASWQRHWIRLTAQPMSWYSTPSGAVGCRFTSILAAEWREVLGRTWNSERPLDFAHVILMKTLGIRRAGEIRSRITRCMDLWERGHHTGLAGDTEA